ncbi:hypothetical protein F5Y15DRAFT_299240 [Xylariaceae sp. FL0016]|nr:hypothetical protein F5Y15DRAFT_299240 [Xylariaceae sp. FL0016]
MFRRVLFSSVMLADVSLNRAMTACEPRMSCKLLLVSDPGLNIRVGTAVGMILVPEPWVIDVSCVVDRRSSHATAELSVSICLGGNGKLAGPSGGSVSYTQYLRCHSCVGS